jgi:hypothetical protein
MAAYISSCYFAFNMCFFEDLCNIQGNEAMFVGIGKSESIGPIFKAQEDMRISEVELAFIDNCVMILINLQAERFLAVKIC